MSTESVVDHHLSSFVSGNLDEIMEDFTDESILLGPTATLRGRDAIRSLFAEFFETLFRPGSYTLTVDRQEIVGELAYIVWRSENEDADVTLGTDTWLVRNGKIVYQTFAAKVDPKQT